MAETRAWAIKTGTGTLLPWTWKTKREALGRIPGRTQIEAWSIAEKVLAANKESKRGDGNVD